MRFLVVCVLGVLDQFIHVYVVDLIINDEEQRILFLGRERLKFSIITSIKILQHKKRGFGVLGFWGFGTGHWDTGLILLIMMGYFTVYFPYVRHSWNCSFLDYR